MAVIEQVTLRGVIPSSQEIQELQQTVMRIENLVERSEAGSRKIRESSQSRQGGIFVNEGADGSLPQNIIRRRNRANTSRQIDAAVSNSFKNKDKTSNNAIKNASAFKEVQTDVLNLKREQATIKEGLGFLTDFQGSVYSKLLGFANKAVPVGFVISIATAVFGLIESQFGAGGIFDIRKLVRDQVKSLVSLEFQTNVVAGEVLFMGNPTLVQGIPDNLTSNTEDLRNGQRRFVLRSNGF